MCFNIIDLIIQKEKFGGHDPYVEPPLYVSGILHANKQGCLH